MRRKFPDENDCICDSFRAFSCSASWGDPTKPISLTHIVPCVENSSHISNSGFNPRGLRRDERVSSASHLYRHRQHGLTRKQYKAEATLFPIAQYQEARISTRCFFKKRFPLRNRAGRIVFLFTHLPHNKLA